MNILFVSKLTGNLWAGPNNSVPAQIKAQSKIDNCFWYNLNSVKRPEWTTDGLNCQNLKDFPSGRLRDLPSPFNKPDIAVLEGVYCFPFEKIINDLITNNIPYVIIPRSTLTVLAQKNKALKKCIGNLIWFNYMIRKSTAIHYLTEAERKESIKKWVKNNFVIPNGTNMQNNVKRYDLNHGIHAVYVGRVEMYQKGMDILIDSIVKIKDLLAKENFSLDIYGPNREGAFELINNAISKHQLDSIIKLHDPVFGEEKRIVLENADVFIMSSRFEGLPMGLIEALSYGLPAVVTEGTNMASEIDHFSAGWTSNNSSEGFTEALKKMINEKQSFELKSANAKELAREYSWDSIAKKSHDEYYSLINKEK